MILPALVLAWATFDESFKAGLMALQRGDLAVAQTNLEAAVKLQPANGRVWIALAQVYTREQRNAEARNAVHKAQPFAAKDSLVAETLGLYYQQMLREQKYSDVIDLVKNADDPQSRLALGVADYGLRRFDDAAGAFLRVIELDPQAEQPYLFLGKFLDQLPGRLPVITRRFEEFAKAHPDHYASYFLLAKVQPGNAEELLRHALELNSADPAVHFDLGAVLDAQKHFDEAAVEFEAAAKLNPNDSAVHYRLSRVYDRLGRADAARAERDIHAKLVQSEDAARQVR